jgi:hypothetical protein
MLIGECQQVFHCRSKAIAAIQIGNVYTSINLSIKLKDVGLKSEDDRKMIKVLCIGSLTLSHPGET